MRGIAAAVVVVALVVAGALTWRSDLPQRWGWRAPPDTGLTLYGNVDIRTVQLGFRVAGKLAELRVDEGDAVKRGDLLARLDEAPFANALHAAEADAATAEATLAKLKAGARPQEIAQARAAVAEAEANLTNLRRTYDRTLNLRATGTASQSLLDQAVAAQGMAAARLDAAREALALLEAGSRTEDIAAAVATSQGAAARRDQAQTSLDDARLVAPEDGVILTRVQEAGAVVAAGSTVYTLSLPHPVWERADVAEGNLGRVAPGQSVQVFTDSRPTKPYQGRIGFVSPVAEFTPKSVETPELRTDLVYRLRVVIEGDPAGLNQGMPVTVRIP